MSAESGSAPLRAQSNPTPLRIGSLCTGYGGLDMAVQRVFGGRLAWVSDVDPGASRILAHHWPAVPNLGDLTTTRWDEVEPVDVVCGGYPCQPFSAAGRRKGTQDERHIWPYIADALRVLRPRYAIFENVANHLRLGFADVLADLARLGFDAEWCLVRASEVGAPHQRNRLFILATAADADGAGLEGRRIPGPAAQRAATAVDAGGSGQHPRSGLRPSGPAEVGQRRPRNAGSAPEAEAACPTCGCPESSHDAGGFCASCANCTDPELGRPAAPDAHGHAVRQQSVTEPWRGGKAVPGGHGAGLAADPSSLRHGHARPASERGLAPASVASGPAAAPDPSSVGRGEGRPEPAREQRRPDLAVSSAQDWGRFASAVARWEAVTGRRAPRATDDRGRLAPAFVEWMMGLPAGHVTAVPGLTRAQQLKALGNGVVPQQAAAALHLLAQRGGMDENGDGLRLDSRAQIDNGDGVDAALFRDRVRVGGPTTRHDTGAEPGQSALNSGAQIGGRNALGHVNGSDESREFVAHDEDSRSRLTDVKSDRRRPIAGRRT